MTRHKPAASEDRHGTAPRVGLFGKLGSGNIGNDASMEAVLGYLRAEHRGAAVDAMCGGAGVVAERYKIPAVPLFWYQRFDRRVQGIAAIPLKVLGKGADLVRTAAWVRRHEAVIVPGMGVLEASLPLPTWEFPYAMFLLSATGRLFNTKVALVSVGAGRINQRWTRRLFNGAAKLAFYRSYRNVGSREAMRQRGLDVTGDHVYPDLAFALPDPPAEPIDPRTVCVGLMAYYGSNDDRKSADQIYSSYVTVMKQFVRWLVDNDRKVRLLVGDTNGSDDAVVQEILADLQASRPDLDPSQVTARSVVTFADVMREMQPAASVVAIRFHNVLAALKLGKPTIAIGYSAKHDALMTDMGVPEFCEPVSALDADGLIQRFKELETRSARLRELLIERKTRNEQLLREQFAELWAALFPSAGVEISAIVDDSAQKVTR